MELVCLLLAIGGFSIGGFRAATYVFFRRIHSLLFMVTDFCIGAYFLTAYIGMITPN